MLTDVSNWIKEQDPTVVAAVIAGSISFLGLMLQIPLRYLIDRRFHRYRLRTEYEQEQRKEVRSLIGSFGSQLTDAGENFHLRMMNLYQSQDKEEDLDVPLDFVPHYYLDSFVYRFVLVVALIDAFEIRLSKLDSRIAHKDDLFFVKLVRAFRWALTDVALFHGLEYDEGVATDHFFRGQLTEIGRCSWDDNELPLDPELLRAAASQGGPLKEAYEFFHGLSSTEARLRWDRLIVFHLLLLAFLNRFGYDMQRSERKYVVEVARRIRHRSIIGNLEEWLPRLGLRRQRYVRQMRWALFRARRSL